MPTLFHLFAWSNHLVGAAAQQVLDATFELSAGPEGLRAGLDRLAQEAERAVDDGFSFLVLSDRSFGPQRVPISPVLAGGRVHHHLVASKKRSCIGIAVESGGWAGGRGGEM